MRHLHLLLIFSVCTFSAWAHTTTHRLGLRLYETLQSEKAKQSNELRHIMVQGNPSQIETLTKQFGGIYKYHTGDISAVAIPIKNLSAFSLNPAIHRIDCYEASGVMLMDSARIVNNIDSVQNGIAPLIQAYKGTGVIIGIIDGGIYFRHKDFQRLNGNTRILNIWDQVDTTGTQLMPYGYGKEWDTLAINGGTCTHQEPAGDFSHGTNVAGIAAGNGSSFSGHPYLNNRYTGTAPDADLMIVSIDNKRLDFLQTIADAVDYIFKKAAALGRPCVVNTSVGTYYGPHDGTELAVKAMETLLDQKKGRVLIASAGNGGAIKHHVSYPLSATDSLFTWFTYNSSTRSVYYDLWADTAQFRGANFAIGCDNSTGTFLGRTRYFNAVADFNPPQGFTVTTTDSLMNGATKLGDYTIATSLQGGLYHVEFQIVPSVTTHLWRLQTKGSGTFDLWASKSLIGTSSIATTAIPAGFSSANYRAGDSLKTIVSAWQCSDKVITVANYSCRASYLDKDSNVVNLTAAPYFETVGALASTSSWGPTRDGRMKPDISATGNTTTATGDSANIALLIANGQGLKVSLGGKHNRNGGTSMSSPIVAGIAALYLEKHPLAGYREVMRVLELTAKKDAFTSFSVPNIRYGWGKVNGYQALKFNVVYGCMDTSSANYNPLATIDTGGCIVKVYGCTDTGSINYNALANTNNGSCIRKVYGCTDTGSINYYALANTNDGSCIRKVYGCTDTGSVNYNTLANTNNGTCIRKVYGITDSTCKNYNKLANVAQGTCIHVGINDLAQDFNFEVIPNPLTSSAVITVSDFPSCNGITIIVYDAIGRRLEEINVENRMHEINYCNTRLNAGVYTFGVMHAGQLLAVKKVVVE